MVRRPLFARCYTQLSRIVERHGDGAHRDELVAGLAGAILEVGAGNGLNLSRYRSPVSRVIALEPEPYLRQDLADVVWKHVAGGCHTGRDTVGAFGRAGFTIRELRRFDFPAGRFPNPARPHEIGRAVRA